MASEYSFDVVSKIDLQAVDDAVNAANKEMSVRYDFRGSKSKIEYDRKKAELKLHSDDEGKLKSVIDILQSKIVKRGLDLKSLDFQKIEEATGTEVRQMVKLVQGITQEKAKKIVADIKTKKIKVNASIKGETVRIASKSKDLLQSVMSFLQGNDYGVPLQFENLR